MAVTFISIKCIVCLMKKSLAELTEPLQKVISKESFTKEDLTKIIKDVRKTVNCKP